MIPDNDCLGFDKESIYSDLGFDKESYLAYLGSRLRLTIESCPFLRFQKSSHFYKKCPFWPILNAALNFYNMPCYV